MTRHVAIAGAAMLVLAPSAGLAQDRSDAVLRGPAALGSWRDDRPGLRRHLTPDALPKPYATRSVGRPPRVVRRPQGAMPRVPDGFEASLFAEGLSDPRAMRTAPNGDVFVAEMRAGRIRVLRARDGGARAETMEVFADNLTLPFGIAFYPPGPNPRWVYVGNTDSVVRFPYRTGDLKARGRPETIVAALPTGGHATRDVAFTPDGTRMLVSVGSDSNVAEGMPPKSVTAAQAWDREHGAIGATWGDEAFRADVLSYTPDGKDRRILATGLRNCVGLAIEPHTGVAWCSTNERDGLGDDLAPDFVTRVTPGAFYGWPWYYTGNHPDPRLDGQRPDLARQVAMPDVLIQPHSAPLQMTFYAGRSFPRPMHGDAFVALHGSWNRSQRTGYKVIRVILKDGVPTGVYEDFMTGFVIDDQRVWARPVGVATAHDGALLVSDDGNGTVWRVAYRGTAR